MPINKSRVIMGQITYLFPALVFFGVFFLTGKDFLKATAAIMCAVTVQVLYEKFSKGTVEKKLFITWIALLVFGSATLLFRDPAFLQWKVSIINWIFSLILIGNLLLRRPPILKNFMKMASAEGLSNIPDKAWIDMTYLWAFAFFSIGTVNLYFMFYTSLTTWVNFKLFGVLGMMFIFAFLNAAYLSKYLSKEAGKSS
ncbi:MAG: septation protein IspZ [SAR86 cluster bacterium]|nr:septation protein IspZ [SAR86 cluster bacterium]